MSLTKAEIKAQLNIPVSKLTFIAFDFVTTGLYAHQNKIVEIGAVKFKNKNTLDTFQTLTNPLMPISSGASRVNGITDKMVKDKPLISQIMPKFLDFIDHSILIAHNAGFDMSFFNHELHRLKFPPISNHVIDTIALAKKTLMFSRSYSLKNLAEQLSLDINGFHRALNDAKACQEIFLHCLAKIPGNKDILLKDLLDLGY